jgi:rod shape-determining protein MreC
VVILTLAAVTLMLVDARGGPTASLRQAATSVFGPLQTWADGALGAAGGVVARPADPAALLAERDDLERQNAALRTELDRLREELQTGGATPPRELLTTSARVVAAGPNFSRSMITIAVGSDDGVASDTAVLSNGALVGRVVAVAASTSTVQLLSDSGSTVAVRLQGSRETALVVGTGDPSVVQMRLFDPLVAVQEGERIVTMGSPEDRPFPAGLRVGTVLSASKGVGAVDRLILVRLAESTTAMDKVDVVLPTSSETSAVERAPAADDQDRAGRRIESGTPPGATDDGAVTIEDAS